MRNIIYVKHNYREYGVWGGLPRYWEVRKQYVSFGQAVKNSIPDQNGLLNEEPERLFSDELRTSVQTYSIRSLIVAGVHRPSEIAARLGKPATQLSQKFGLSILPRHSSIHFPRSYIFCI